MNMTDTTGSEAVLSRGGAPPDPPLPSARAGKPAVADAAAPPGALAKAATLIEALPWLERLHGETVVIKFGGHAMTDEALCLAFAQDVVFLRYAGLRPLVVHGGGPQISEHLGRLGIPTTFAAGLRVTTPETMDVVRMVLTGQVNRDVVGQINRHGPFVISSVARGAAGEVYNVNADTAAAAIAVALGAAKLVLLTDVAGLYADWPGASDPAGPDPAAGRPREVISQLDAAELAAMLPGLSEGMIPKMQACLTAVRGGVPRAHVLDGRLPHAILLEIFTDSGIGTMVVPDGAGS